MPRRRNQADYAGATARMTWEQACKLARTQGRWAIQPKIDGCYVRLSLDAQGRVANVLSRPGKVMRTEAARSMLGVFAGYPYSELVGELTDHTEWGLEQFRDFGAARVHLFDILRSGRRYLGDQPYHARRDALWSMYADLEQHVGPSDLSRSGRGAGGRFCSRVPSAHGRLEIVPQAPLRALERCWADWVADVDGEGLVFVRLDSAIGARAAKRKLKHTVDFDATVERVSGKTALLRCGTQAVAVGAGKWELEPGQIVTIMGDGTYRDGLPRHARITRIRSDLM